MTREEGKLVIEKKVDDFYRNEKELLSKSFQEKEARTRFIDPFFEALGWDFDQTELKKDMWDIHQEFSQKDNSSTKKPDYAFRVREGKKFKVKFFVEAKAPWVKLTDNDPVYQAKRYSFSSHGKTPIVILTDFQEFRVFNGMERPIFENPLQGLVKGFDLKYTDYLDKWDLLYDTFSKDAVYNGSIDKIVGKISKNTKTLDDEFLHDITEWRELLARNIAIRNKDLTVNELNEAVQRIIDRLIFIRNLEDREIEPENLLSGILTNKENLFSNLVPLFSKLNESYNGLLFKPHFSEKLSVDDKVVKDIIKKMCYPISPFQFDIIEPEILGRIYERFLGSKIRLTENHQAKVEEKPEVRHAGGVYYTPQYIVDYISENTVGELIKEKTPEDIENIKILDPACGSGSFLIGAFDYLIKYHENYFASLNQSGQKKYKDDFYKTEEGEVKLTLSRKSTILKNNIFGVDIDREATEVAIMSLYLKLLDEGYDRGQAELFMKGHILPDMTGNIKCGNSLIDREALFSNDLFGDEEIEPFDWKDEKNGFGNIFKKNGGFDAVIGNPPYIRIQEMIAWAPKTVEIYKKTYKSGSQKNYDIYVLFIEKALSLLNKTGLSGYILPNKFMQQDYGESIRDILSSNQSVHTIINFKDFQVFKGATTYTCLLFISNNSKEGFKYSECLNDTLECDFSTIKSSYLTKEPWNLHGTDDLEFINKLSGLPILGDICDNIFVGIQTSADKIFIMDIIEENETTYKLFSKALNQEIYCEKIFTRHIVSGVDVKKYTIPQKRQVVIFPYVTENGKPALITKKQFEIESPLCWKYLTDNKKTLENRESGKMKGDKWYGYVYLKNMTIQDKRKICVPRLVKDIQAVYDEHGSWCLDNVDVGGVILKQKYTHLYDYIVGVLNSKLLTRYLSKISTPFRGGFWSCNRQYLEKLPIYIPDPNNKEKYSLCLKIEEMVKKILELKKVGKDADASFLEKKIDEMVETIYEER